MLPFPVALALLLACALTSVLGTCTLQVILAAVGASLDFAGVYPWVFTVNVCAMGVWLRARLQGGGGLL